MHSKWSTDSALYMEHCETGHEPNNFFKLFYFQTAKTYKNLTEEIHLIDTHTTPQLEGGCITKINCY